MPDLRPLRTSLIRDSMGLRTPLSKSSIRPGAASLVSRGVAATRQAMDRRGKVEEGLKSIFASVEGKVMNE